MYVCSQDAEKRQQLQQKAQYRQEMITLHNAIVYTSLQWKPTEVKSIKMGLPSVSHMLKACACANTLLAGSRVLFYERNIFFCIRKLFQQG